MHDLIVSLVMLAVLAVAPWTANALAVRTVARFGNAEDASGRAELQHVD